MGNALSIHNFMLTVEKYEQIHRWRSGIVMNSSPFYVTPSLSPSPFFIINSYIFLIAFPSKIATNATTPCE